MTASRAARGVTRALRLKPIEHSLYFGRERLGRYVQIDRRRFRAFDAVDSTLCVPKSLSGLVERRIG
jgi:hypothetical protein